MSIAFSVWTRFTLVALLLGASGAHAFEMQTLEDKRTNLHEFIGDGRWSVVMFWQQNCVACEKQKPMLEAFHNKYKNTRARAIGVSTDGIENLDYITGNIKKHGTSYTNLVVLTDVFNWQFEQETGKQYRSSPTYLLYAPDGKLVGVRDGPLDFAVLEKILNEE